MNDLARVLALQRACDRATMDLNEVERYAAAALFTLALHSTHVSCAQEWGVVVRWELATPLA